MDSQKQPQNTKCLQWPWKASLHPHAGCKSIVNVLPLEAKVFLRVPCSLRKDKTFTKWMPAWVIVKHPKCAEIEVY